MFASSLSDFVFVSFKNIKHYFFENSYNKKEEGRLPMHQSPEHCSLSLCICLGWQLQWSGETHRWEVPSLAQGLSDREGILRWSRTHEISSVTQWVTLWQWCGETEDEKLDALRFQDFLEEMRPGTKKAQSQSRTGSGTQGPSSATSAWPALWQTPSRRGLSCTFPCLAVTPPHNAALFWH